MSSPEQQAGRGDFGASIGGWPWAMFSPDQQVTHAFFSFFFNVDHRSSIS
jgi:hypothetical protein